MTEQALTNQAALMACSHEDALEVAVREHARLVFRIAYSVLRNHHDAEDATQETFVRALRFEEQVMERIHNRQSMKTQYCKCARN